MPTWVTHTSTPWKRSFAAWTGGQQSALLVTAALKARVLPTAHVAQAHIRYHPHFMSCSATVTSPPTPCESNALFRATAAVVATTSGTVELGNSIFWWSMTINFSVIWGWGMVFWTH